MSYNTIVANPVSLTSLNPNSIVSDLENALIQNVGQGLQTGQSTNSESLQQEMQLLTDLLNQSSNSASNSGPTSSSDPSTSSSSPSTSSDPSTSSTTNDSGMGKPERKLETALEKNITDRLQNGQSPNNGNALQQEMNLLIELLGQNA